MAICCCVVCVKLHVKCDLPGMKFSILEMNILHSDMVHCEIVTVCKRASGNKSEGHGISTQTHNYTDTHTSTVQESDLSLSGAAPQVYESREVATTNHKLCLKCEG